MHKLHRGVTVQQAIDAALAAGCSVEQGEDRSELHLSHPKLNGNGFVLRTRSLERRRDRAPLPMVRFVNRAIESAT